MWIWRLFVLSLGGESRSRTGRVRGASSADVLHR
uniref:Uncharacterized protein n=1 Tax=Arundo donax TaxID=35708 RepID=A0A0A8Z1C3_ARUDO